MKKIRVILLLMAILISINKINVFAAEDAIPSITIDVELEQDGSANITEVWQIKNVTSGTEYYKALYHMEEMSVDSFRVSDESNKDYQIVEKWDTKKTREEKAGTCGILKTSKGYELCWGIGEYGDHTYTIRYKLNGLVKIYGDYAGFYHQFLSELSSAPQMTSVMIRMNGSELNETNARIWGYGFKGNVGIEKDGVLNAVSTKALRDNDYVNLLCRFSTSLFPFAASSNQSFEELENAANDTGQGIAIGFLVFLGILSIGIIGSIVFFYGRYELSDGTKVRVRARNITSNASIPFEGNLPAVFYSLELLRKPITYHELLGAYITRWQKAGYVRLEEHVVSLNKKKEENETAITFLSEPVQESELEIRLYKILQKRADQDNILWSHKIEKDAEKLSKELSKWEKSVKKEGKDTLLLNGIIAKIRKKEYAFTPGGFEQAIRIMGLKKYLTELVKESKSPEQTLWGDYLVFALLFHTESKVLQIMKESDPAYFNMFAGYYGFQSYNMLHFMVMTNHMTSQVSTNTSGMGGSSASIGGGGFSGGGGGGSR